ncbi:hypothetical protein CG419_04055 [Latilactobacillus curvatus]|uniref:Uncharacterized protein n=1 Tax=Latilactobacillus curvatus TaxID=28038 RepID=A0AAC9UMG6_LATCU|nr:hypothetical protein [Latilactobacillus curvatus]ASN59848.1 hypothetical protein CG419_04055 [Latilactobacillus curvatus]
MKKLKDFQFGYADAEKEFTRIPEIFDESFYDYRQIAQKLIEKDSFLLVGRKGVGKSAVNARIRYLSTTKNNLNAFPLQLNDFEYTTFGKTSVDRNVIGTQKYKDSWDFFMLVTIIKFLYNNVKITESVELNKIIEVLEQLGFKIKNNLKYKQTVTRLSKIKVGAASAAIELAFENLKTEKPDTFQEIMSLLNEEMYDAIETTYTPTKEIIIMIDGVDDILRLRKNQLDILSSLIRSVDYLNDKFFKDGIKIKITVCIREDILIKITDPDLNKIKRDGSLTIDWSQDTDGLKKVVALRFKFSGINSEDSESYWYEIFPKEMQNKDSWEHVLEYTLYKPRDVLQFLKSCQELYPENAKLSFKQVSDALKAYSKDYFIEEMKNEVTGFVSEQLIILLPVIFQRLGSNQFSYSEFRRNFDEQSTTKIKNSEEVKLLLALLFESGYVGQLIKNKSKYGRETTSVIFKYRNPGSQVDFNQTFIIHKGIQKGLGIKLN